MMEDQVANLLAGARVLHLQPDDVLVIELSRELTQELAHAIVEGFGDRRVVVTAPGVKVAGTCRLDDVDAP